MQEVDGSIPSSSTISSSVNVQGRPAVDGKSLRNKLKLSARRPHLFSALHAQSSHGGWILKLKFKRSAVHPTLFDNAPELGVSRPAFLRDSVKFSVRARGILHRKCDAVRRFHAWQQIPNDSAAACIRAASS
jgi:hypothetical protein